MLEIDDAVVSRQPIEHAGSVLLVGSEGVVQDTLPDGRYMVEWYDRDSGEATVVCAASEEQIELMAP